MGELNKTYRGLKDLRKVTQSDRESKRLRGEIKKHNKESDHLEATRLNCSIKDDWIIEIEKGLEFISNAIAEDRQFIRTEGEVIPIEKVKKVSKSSVEHLAKHSNLITRAPKDDKGIIPEKLYIVEKLSDYAVYENRFLYFLLVSLEAFVELRLVKIQEIMNTYKGILQMDKKIKISSREINFKLDFYESRTDNPYPIINEETNRRYNRILGISSAINTLMNTTLIQEVSKAPMIKAPIVKNNVLKMDNNFIKCVELYDFIVSYKEDGYSFSEEKKSLNPFPDEMSDEAAELVSLTSFLAFEYGNDLNQTFKAEYDEEEKLIEAENQRLLGEKIKKLRREVAQKGITDYEYMLMLEKRNDYLEPLEGKLQEANLKIDELNLEISNLNDQIKNLKDDINSLNLEIENLKIAHAKEIEELNLKFKKEIEDINLAHQNEIEELNKEFEDSLNSKILEAVNEYKERLDSIDLEHSKEIEKIEHEYDLRIEELNELNKSLELSKEELKDEFILKEENLNKAHEEEIQKYIDKIDNLNNLSHEKDLKHQSDLEEKTKELKDEKDEVISKYDDINLKYNNLLSDYKMTKAEMLGYKKKLNLITKDDDYSSKEKFTELEEVRDNLDKFIKAQWKDAKKEIRKNILWAPAPKKEKKVKGKDIKPQENSEDKREESSIK